MAAIDGLVSGLDTTSIIASLMAVERAPQDALVASQTKVQAALDAYSLVRDKLSAVGTAATALATADKWNARTATSTNSSVATVTATDTAALGSLSFTVDQLATAHGLRSGNVITLLDTVIASGGNVTLDTGDGPQNIAVGSGSLTQVVAAINGANQGVRAVAVNTGSGYRLQLTSTTTGADSAFTISGLDASVGGTVATTVGADAKLTIGNGPGAYSVTSKSNTFANIVPGMSITATSVSTTPVTVTVDQDVAALSKKVKALVDSANAALLQISSSTAYNAETKAAASLNGDTTVRRAVQDLTRAMSEIVGSSSLQTGGAAGIQLGRNGRFTFDEAKFTAAYNADPAAVRSLFTQNGSATGAVEFASAGARTIPGSYDVVVTQAATKAIASGGLAGAWPAATNSTIGVRIGATVINYAVAAGTSLADATAGLQSAVTTGGLGLTVTNDGSGLSISSQNYGTAATFDVAWDGVTWATQTGVDVAGTINGVTAVGIGRQLTAPADDPTVGSLSVRVTDDALGAHGAVTYGAGIAQRVASAISSATDVTTGYLTSAESTRKQKITNLQKSIDRYEVRLTAHEKNLKTYWAALEVSLNNLKSQSSNLASQIAGLSTGS